MPCEAAANASDRFTEYIQEYISGVRHTQRLGQLMLQGLEAAHQAVLAPSKFKLSILAACTTIVVGMTIYATCWQIATCVYY